MGYEIADFGNLVFRSADDRITIFSPEDGLAFAFNDDGILAHGAAARVIPRVDRFRAACAIEPGGVTEGLTVIEVSASEVTADFAREINACLDRPGLAAGLLEKLSALSSAEGSPAP